MPKAKSQATAPDLPVWKLDDLYMSPTDPALARDLDSARAAAAAFAGRFKDKIATLDGAAFAEAIAAYEDISERITKAMAYGQLLFAVNMSDTEVARFYQSLSEQVTETSTLTLFFTLEINRMEDGALANLIATSEGVAHYQPWLDEVRQYRPHQLSDDLEKFILEKSVTGRTAWVRLFEETFAEMRFEVEGDELTQSEVLNLMSDTDGAKRKAAAKAFGKGLEAHIRLLGLITNTLAKDKEVEDRWRQFSRPVSERNLANQVEDEVVDALVRSVHDSYAGLSHRYYALKAKWFGCEKLDYWDRNAPLPFDDPTLYSWKEAETLVLDAFGAFSPKMAAVAGDFFNKGWIDARPRAGKDSGAFAHPVVPSAHPYVMLNFHGKSRDVMTLAHELGHGVHQVLAAGQGTLMSDTPLTTAETASVFGEMLTFRSMVEGETNPALRKALLAGKVEDMLNTVVRQVAFHEFEAHVHDERKSGELSQERLSEIWLEVQHQSLGPAIRFDDEYKHYWAYIPHFVHTPFYVYAYAFGDCLVNSLYDVYRHEKNGEKDSFQDRYFAMLSAGGSRRHQELLAPFGLDAADPGFWKRGLGVVGSYIDELEALE